MYVQIANSSKNPVTKEVFIFRHVFVVLFLSKIIIKSKSNPDWTVNLKLLKIVICQTLLLFKWFSLKYHLFHEIFKNYIKYPSSHLHHDLFWHVYLTIDPPLYATNQKKIVTRCFLVTFGNMNTLQKELNWSVVGKSRTWHTPWSSSDSQLANLGKKI